MREELPLDFHLWIASFCIRPNILEEGVHSRQSRFVSVNMLSHKSTKICTTSHFACVLVS